MATTTKPKQAGTVNKLTSQAKGTARRPAVQFLGRLGYVAKGLVYIIIGGLAALAAIGNGNGQTTDRKGALQTVYEQPFGKFLLAIVAFGLLCYALWSLVQALADTENKGSDAKGLAQRGFKVAVAVSYGLLALAATQLALGKTDSSKSSDTNAQDWTGELLKQPFGPILVIIAGLVVLGVAGFQFYRAYKANFQKHLDMSQLRGQAKQWAVRFGQVGLAARGIVFAVIGIFLIVAALNRDANRAKGLGGALQELSQQPYGQLLLGLVAVGLIAYGLYSWVEARYRRMVER